MRENFNNFSEIISNPIENHTEKVSRINNRMIMHNQIRTLKSEDDSKINRIKKKLKEMLVDSTIHALPNIYKTDRILFKIMWFSFFLTTLAFSIQLITKSVDDYLKYETITQFNYDGYERPGN